MGDFLYGIWYRFNCAWRIAVAWRPHHLWCQARAYRSANSLITMTEGTITLAACKCGVARAYDSAGPVWAGCLVSAPAFRCK